LHQIPHSTIRHPCPCLQLQTPICLYYPLGFLSLHHQQGIFDENMGNFLEWRQLRTHPTLSGTWNTSYANKLGCLGQGIGTGPNKGKRIKGTNTLFPIPYDKIPSDCRREISYSKVVCKV
jgi:hypothetical protein